MRSEQPVRCAKCYLRMEQHDLQIIHYKAVYHRHCFLILFREKAGKVKQVLAGSRRAE